MRTGDGALIDRLFLRLASAGYTITPAMGNPEQVIRRRGFRVQLRLGEVAEADSSQRLVMSVDVDLHGDVATPGLRRWRVTRSFVEFDGGVEWELRVLIKLSGDLSDDFFATEGCNAGGLLGSLISDGRMGLFGAREPPSLNPSAPLGPDLIIELSGVGDLATGSCRLAWHGERRGGQTPEHRRIRLAACDRLSEEVLPLLAVACRAALGPTFPKQRQEVPPCSTR
jgi:hypothetical protein